MCLDFQKVADSISAMACIVSVEKCPDGSCGEIRIVTGNKAYIESIEKPIQDVEMLTRAFVPNSLYTSYLPRDLNFEDYCYRAAVQKKCLHSYAHPDRFDVWFNMTFLPLSPEDGNLCYCIYIMEINSEPNSERISNISGDIAASVLETAIKLREAKSFKTAIRSTVRDIRKLCDAESCCIMLVDHEQETCEVLGWAYAEDIESDAYENYWNTDFYSIARTWKDTISGSNCLIAKNEKDLEVVAERNPLWYQSLKNAGVRTIALFPLKSRNEHLGYIWAANFEEERSAQIKEILELTTFVLGSETGNYLMMNKLEKLSSQDMLTGVMNRNRMNDYVEELSQSSVHPTCSVGVIFTDLNGLKRINDSQGHGAGDALLRNAASALMELFPPETIYRAGGDEFVVILTGVSREQTEEKAQMLSETAKRYPHVSFAIGCGFDENSKNIRNVLSLADERMYEDKKRYYSGKDKRQF